ncbi:putative ATPase [Yersinia intermedia]|uniref:AAA family ATPase n=1 Tax=Yersinia intermedia TaxID=631 RepID=UPI0005E98967|nr:AAA family ATPase [Yersinia intermedia]CNJ12185.1 putative ATPase [Yersinia intermedia]
MITRLAISGYRSLRDVVLELGQLNVITGANGSGKSSLYRALRLLSDIGQGQVIQSLAAEGGLQSTLWAGPESFSKSMTSGEQPIEGTNRHHPVSLKLGFAGADYGYAIDLGLPTPRRSFFALDPEIKIESLWCGDILNNNALFAERRGPRVRIRDERGLWREAYHGLAAYDSMMTHSTDPRDAPELLLMRERMRAWRFYDNLRTDRHAPARQLQVGTYTPVLASDGADLAAALQTIREIGDTDALTNTITDAFPGTTLAIEPNFELLLSQQGLLRPLKVAELSDGTLRYLLLVAALLSPRPPEMMILNEPEISLHVDLLKPLARLIGQAAQHTQVIVVSHAAELVAALQQETHCRHILLDKQFSETTIQQEATPHWLWSAR